MGNTLGDLAYTKQVAAQGFGGSRSGRRVIFRRISLWAYIALFVIGVVSFVRYQQNIRSEATVRHWQTITGFERSAHAGVYWIIYVSSVDHQVVLFNNRFRYNPITTSESYILNVQYNGVRDAQFCATTSIRSIGMELVGAAFTIVPSATQLRPITDYCGGDSHRLPAITWKWEILAKQGGLHAAALRIFGLDSQQHQVEDETFEVPILVEEPFTLIPIATLVVTLLGGTGTALSIWDALKRRRN